jgi:serine/threonine-protein phosphatase 2A regulatory subunit A
MLATLVTDDIPNIRFNVAKSYQVLIATLRKLPESGTLADIEKGKAAAPAEGGTKEGERLVREEILPNLEKLMADDDVDVRYFATVAAGGSRDAEGMDVE